MKSRALHPDKLSRTGDVSSKTANLSNKILSFEDLAGLAQPNYPELWQCIGMIVGVYGIGYAIAARDPVRHWPIVLVGLLGKILGPIGFLGAVLHDRVPLEAGLVIVTNDLIWWPGFALALWLAWRARQSRFSPTRQRDYSIAFWHGTLRANRS